MAIMQSGWRAVAAKFHEDLRRAVAEYKGVVLKAYEVNAIARLHPSMAKDAQFIQASDHCVNHTNDGACDCALTDKAIFERVGHGEYLVR